MSSLLVALVDYTCIFLKNSLTFLTVSPPCTPPSPFTFSYYLLFLPFHTFVSFHSLGLFQTLTYLHCLPFNPFTLFTLLILFTLLNLFYKSQACFFLFFHSFYPVINSRLVSKPIFINLFLD